MDVKDRMKRERTLVMTEQGRGGIKNTKTAYLTLEMESLLVHSDGECAVVLVIYADHSSLGKQREVIE